MASVPPVSRDALIHHLAVPKIWIEKGLFKELPSIPFSYYPMNLELMYLIPLYFGNDIVPKYIHFSFGLFTAFLIYNYLKRRLNARYALLGALFFLSVPIIVKLSTTAYVDLGLIFFTTASLLGLIKWIENGYRLRDLIFSAIWCGLALGTKYNGLITLLLLTCSVPILYIRQPANKFRRNGWVCQLKGLGWGLIFASVSLVIFSPWMIRNVTLTGDPIYPLYNEFFNGIEHGTKKGNALQQANGEEDSPVNMNHGWKHFAIRKVIYGESLWQIGLTPLRIFFEGQDGNPKYFDGELNPFLLILPLLLLVFPEMKKDRIRITEYKVLSLFTVGYLLFVFFAVDMRIRWISPVIPPLVILSMFALERLFNLGENSDIKWKSLFSRGAVTVAVIGLLLFNARYIHALYQKIDPWSYISGKIDRESYIKKFRPEYDLISYANQRLPENASILCLFIGNRIYYFNRNVNLDKGILRNAVLSSNTIKELSFDLRCAGVTDILLRYDLTNAWINNNFANNKRIMLKDFFERHTKILRSYGGYGLYKVETAG